MKNTFPTLDTAIVEQYLSRYINRIAISRNRLKYIKSQQKVKIIYNDYKNQEQNKAPPKEIKILHPLEAINQIMAHVLPPYFQKSRYYGLHAAQTYKRVKDQIPNTLQRNNRTIRTVFEILSQLLKLSPYQCEKCQRTEYDVKEVRPDKRWKEYFLILPSIRPPPFQSLHITHNL